MAVVVIVRAPLVVCVRCGAHALHGCLRKGRGLAAGRSALLRQAPGARVAVTNAEGSVLLDTDPPAPGERSLRTRPEVDTALGGRVATGSRYSQTLGTELLYVAVPVAAGARCTAPCASPTRRPR